MGNTLRIQTDDWGDGVMRLYFYDGTLHSVTDITPYNDQIVVEVESDYTRILFWSYTTKSGRLYRGSVVTH
ncbi:MAG: hypothetical protein J5I53_01785 [Bradyrhizobiaceae bacterium]|nr:hypothetical protein [Bradyrhizobiaceae bacterium]